MAGPYERLIISNRHRLSTAGTRPIEVESESDRARLIFSSPFRRLQSKAQVFPLETGTAVRSRLTHSLEVAHIGKYIAQTIIRKLGEEKLLESLGLCEGREVAFVNLVETACLMHDIGNPPFGHFGEYAIRDWFNRKEQGLIKKAIKNARNNEIEEFEGTRFQDFVRFDGNPQGLRIITKLQGIDGLTGLNLTYSQLGAYLKYVVPSHLVNEDKRSTKKPGFFHSESEVVRAMWKSLEIEEYKRHPLAYLMEAADDIAFCMSDIEDGIEKRIMTEDFFKDELIKEWKDLIGNDKDNKSYIPDIVRDCWLDSNHQVIAPFVKFKTKVTNDLVNAVAESYIENHNSVIKGEMGPLIQEGTKERVVLDALQNVVRRNIYRSREAEDIELGGSAVVSGLLSHLARLLQCPRDDFVAIMKSETRGPTIGSTDLERRLFNLLTEKHVKVYQKSIEIGVTDIEEWYYRAHLILDYVAGMTDDYALETYQLLSGIKVE